MVQFGSEINKTIIEKFAQLKQGIRQISTGNLNYKVQLEGRDEFVELAGHFNEMGDRLKDAIEKEREKERLQHELAIARQVQLGLLPKELPKIPDFEIAANLETANEVGGDFYDIAEAGDGKYLITIGDVSGKGTSAAFYMAQCICLIRFSMQFTREPAEIAVRLNEYFAGPTVDKEVFVTAIIGLLDSKSGKFQFVRAGHTMPFYLPADKSKKINEIKSTGLGIGLAKKNSFMKRVLKPKEIEFRRGDSVILCTDGLLEAARPGPAWDDEDNGKVVTFYGEERFKALLENSRDLSPAAILETVQNDIETFYGGAPRVDDYTLIILRRD
jgi:sigma-B regulation protein RsbU (phosphoserine phosphatase)